MIGLTLETGGQDNGIYKRFGPVVVIGLILAYLSMFRVYQWEQAIVFKFREVQDTVNEPGLHFMIPWINTVQKFETRL